MLDDAAKGSQKSGMHDGVRENQICEKAEKGNPLILDGMGWDVRLIVVE